MVALDPCCCICYQFDNNAALSDVTSADYQVRITAAGSTDVEYNSATLPVSDDVTANLEAIILNDKR